MTSCDACGGPFTRKRSWQRYCSTRCRSRYARGARAPATAEGAAQRTGPGPVEVATRRELEAAGTQASVRGQLVLALARRLDEADRDTGGGMAAVAKQFHASLAAALDDGKPKDDPLDELATWRERKVAAAAAVDRPPRHQGDDRRCRLSVRSSFACGH